MILSIKKAAKLMLAAVCCGLGLEANAQNVAASGAFTAATLNDITFTPTPQNCLNLGDAAGNNVTLTLTPPSGTLANDVSWRVLGDYGSLSATGTGTSFVFRAGNSKGKLRVILTYTQDGPCVSRTFTCAPNPSQTILVPSRTVVQRSFDFYKYFTTNPAIDIEGPRCLGPGNNTVVYSIKGTPISLKNQIDAGIGTDSYSWTVTGLPSGFSAIQDGGDGASITISNPSPSATLSASTYTVSAKVGRCNGTTTPFSVTVASDLNNGGVISFPYCLNVGLTAASFTFVKEANVAYTLSTTIGTLSATSFTASDPAGNQVIGITGIPANATGTVTVVGTGSGGCFGTQRFVGFIGRSLLSAQNKIEPTCLLPSTANQPVTLSNPPIGQTINWTVTGTGWSITSGQGTASITVTTGSGAGSLTATPAGCTGLTQAISVTSTTSLSGVCSPLVVTRFTPTGYQYYYISSSTPTCASPCLDCAPSGTSASDGITYSWVVDGGTANQQTFTTFENAKAFSPALPAGSHTFQVTLVDRRSGRCYQNSTTGTITVSRATSGGTEPAPVSGQLPGQLRQLNVYPNPASNELIVDLRILPTKSKATLTLTDVTGRIVQQTSVDKPDAVLNVRELPEGSYMLRVTSGDKIVYQHVVVRH